MHHRKKNMCYLDKCYLNKCYLDKCLLENVALTNVDVTNVPKTANCSCRWSNHPTVKVWLSYDQ